MTPFIPNRATRRKMGLRMRLNFAQAPLFMPRFVRRHHEHRWARPKMFRILRSYGIL